MNDLAAVFQAVFDILSIRFTIWGLEFSFLQIVLWSIVAGAVIWLISYWLKD